MFIAVVLHTVSSPGTFVYAYKHHRKIGVLSVVFSALVTVVFDSARSSDTVLFSIWDTDWDKHNGDLASYHV